MKNSKGNIGIFISLLIVVAFIIVLGFVLVKENNENNIKGENISINQNEILETENNEVEDTLNNINMEESKTNLSAKNGDILSMNYTGRLENGTIFDSNVLPEFNHVEPFEFTLGAGQVIAGWDEGLLGMKVGEKKTLTISPEKAYGSMQVGPIPPNSTLIFEVELLEIK